jgi:hypothetical protein
VPLLHIEILIFKKHYNINFWWHFKVPQANCLWANLGILGSFGLCSASNWKATIHIYSLKKFQKIQKFIAFTAAYSKVQKAILVAIVL